MGLIVLFCYLQVSFILPLFLHVWYIWLLPVENFIFTPFTFCCKYKKRRNYTSIPPVRMRDLLDDNDSGIDVLDQGNGSENSENSSMGSAGSNSAGSDSSSTESVEAILITERPLLEMEPLHMLEANSSSETAKPLHEEDNLNPTAESWLTSRVQAFLLRFLAVPVMILQVWRPKFHCVSNRVGSVLRLFIRLGFVWLFVIILAMSLGKTTQLKVSDHQPQFFDPDTNIQKMLDLEGNLTEPSGDNCGSCSAWSTHYTGKFHSAMADCSVWI